ncbi:hypothetical protein M9H77_16414 [Catharanthus roseus]|uniref:Uncharacterized protein n=1 Tax=Catharanthus roseus TaxID=4058 RepID=A0ACC0B1Q1_CATRO|nr:hypothetical protein M9H77_16414 [Catharanthus roseus]
METKLNSSALMFDRISLEHPYTCTSMLGKNHTMEFEEQGELVGKELSLCHEDSLISHFLNPSLLSHEVSYVKRFEDKSFNEKGYDVKTTKDHSTNFGGATSCIREVKTS